MAKRSNEQSIGEVIKEVIKAHGLESGITQVKIATIWDKVMGKYIAGKTSKITLHKDVLTIEIDSAALRSELSYSKENIMNTINQKAGKNVINKIIIR